MLGFKKMKNDEINKNMNNDEIRRIISRDKFVKTNAEDEIQELENELKRRSELKFDGVPCFSIQGNVKYNVYDDEKLLNCFHSCESAMKHAEMLKQWRKALADNSMFESIDVEVVCPLLPVGYVVSDHCDRWFYFKDYPEYDEKEKRWFVKKEYRNDYGCLLPFNFKAIPVSEKCKRFKCGF